MDISYLLYLQNFREITKHILDDFFVYVTGYGEMVCLLPLFALIYWCINKKTGEFMFLTLAFARLINGFVKILACIYRPWIKAPGKILPLGNGLKTAKGYSFPSGHTTNAVATFGSFAVKQDNDAKFLKLFLWILAILVGFSRNYIGVHTPQDVIVGFILTVVTIFGTIKVFDFIEKDKNAYLKVAVSGLVISLLIVVFAINKSYPINFRNDDNSVTATTFMKTSELTKDIEKKAIVNPKDMVLDLYSNIGYIVGIFLGWLIERRFVNFSTEGTTSQKILRFLVCFVIMQIMLQVLCPFIKEFGKVNDIKVYTTPIISFLKTFYILGIAPFIIKFMQKKQM